VSPLQCLTERDLDKPLCRSPLSFIRSRHVIHHRHSERAQRVEESLYFACSAIALEVTQSA
jgi:hypothetical protein